MYSARLRSGSSYFSSGKRGLYSLTRKHQPSHSLPAARNQYSHRSRCFPSAARWVDWKPSFFEISARLLQLVLPGVLILGKHKIVEFYGGGVGEISLAYRASPEYGATMGFFLVDHEQERGFAVEDKVGQPAELKHGRPSTRAKWLASSNPLLLPYSVGVADTVGPVRRYFSSKEPKKCLWCGGEGTCGPNRCRELPYTTMRIAVNLFLQPERYPCPICEIFFKSPSELTMHYGGPNTRRFMMLTLLPAAAVLSLKTPNQQKSTGLEETGYVVDIIRMKMTQSGSKGSRMRRKRLRKWTLN